MLSQTRQSGRVVHKYVVGLRNIT